MFTLSLSLADFRRPSRAVLPSRTVLPLSGWIHHFPQAMGAGAAVSVAPSPESERPRGLCVCRWEVLD